MQLQVPFYKNVGNNCGPIAVKMVLEYLGERHSLRSIQRSSNPEQSDMTWTLALALATAKVGFRTEFYSTYLGFNPKNENHEFYHKNADIEAADKKMAQLHTWCRNLGVKETEQSLSLDEILGRLSTNCAIIALLDVNRIDRKPGYHGHFVPIVGYDKRYVYIHDSGPLNAVPHFRLTRRQFDIARTAPGTDEDIIFIHRKR